MHQGCGVLDGKKITQSSDDFVPVIVVAVRIEADEVCGRPLDQIDDSLDRIRLHGIVIAENPEPLTLRVDKASDEISAHPEVSYRATVLHGGVIPLGNDLFGMIRAGIVKDMDTNFRCELGNQFLQPLSQMFSPIKSWDRDS